MGIVLNKEAIAGINKGFSNLFQTAFTSTPTNWQRVAMEVPSTGASTLHGWLNVLPKMRQWVGDRHIKNLEIFSYSITNLDWESSIGVKRNDILDDMLGIYNPVISEMGRAAAAHPDELIFGTTMVNAFSAACYDSQFFFDTDHPVGSGTVSNYGGGSGTAWYLLDTTRAVKPFIFQNRQAPQFVALDNPDDPNVFYRKEFVYGVDRRDNAGYGLWQLAYASKQDLDPDSYSAARAAMQAFKDDEGKPLGVMPNLLVVPPSLESVAREILINERTAAGATNTWRNTAELLVTPWLT